MDRGFVAGIGLILVVAACGGGTSLPGAPSTDATAVSTAATSRASTTTAPPATTRTTAATTTTPAPIAATPSELPEGTVGFVGCSVSQNAVAGYTRFLGGTRMWPPSAPYGGGSLGRWERGLLGDRSRYWSGFDELLAEHPDTKTIWFSLCTFRGAPVDNVDTALAILTEVRRRLPDAVVYVSGQPTYSGGHFCELAGDTGAQKMAEIAAELVNMGVALAGPVMGPLAADETSDGCHANETGMELMGRQLLDFFG